MQKLKAVGKGVTTMQNDFENLTYMQHIRLCHFFGVKARNPISFLIWKIKKRFKIKSWNKEMRNNNAE